MWEPSEKGIIEVDADRRVRFCNGHAKYLFGLEEDAVGVGSDIKDVYRRILEKSVSVEGQSTFPAVMLGDRLGDRFLSLCTGHVVECRAIRLCNGGYVETFIDVTERRLAENAIRVSESRYRLLADNCVDVIILSGLDAVQRYVSPAAEAMLGYSHDELVGAHPEKLFHPDDIKPCLELYGQLYAGKIARMAQVVRYRHKLGHWVWTEVSTSLAIDPETGRRIGFVSTVRDIGERRRAEEALRLSEERLSLALGVGSDGLWDWDRGSGSVQVSAGWALRLGLSSTDVPLASRRCLELVDRADRAMLVERLRGHFLGKTTFVEAEVRLGSPICAVWTLVRGKVVDRGPSGTPSRIVGTFVDISQRKETEHQVRQLALYDGLTGLPNRILFRERLNDLVATVRTGDRHLAVLACDLDHLKLVNDTMGLAAGDMLMRVTAARLTAVMGAGELVARLGGDEFFVVIGDLTETDDASGKARRLIDAMGEPVVLGGKAFGTGISIGIALGSGQGCTAEEVFKQAETALEQAKADGGNVCRVFAPDALARSNLRARMAFDMKEAIRREEFRLVYQPVVDVRTGGVVSFEALMRWRHPERGEISPEDFIPVAEESGSIIQLGTWALREACREAMSWPSDVRVAVNVSPLQFRDGLDDVVRTALLEAHLPARRLNLEVTESVLMLDSIAVLSCLHRMREFGLRIVLDDFGTGFSSLSYIRRFPFDAIKIDRAFIRDIDHPDTAAIVRGIVDIGKRLGMTITAEGVETEDQLRRVCDEGCTAVQGYYFSKPLEADDARA